VTSLRPRVLFLAQRVPLGEAAPNGSSAHVAATLAGLRANFEVLAFGAAARGSRTLTTGRRFRLPRLVSGARQDFRAVVADARFARTAFEAAGSFRPDVVYERSEYLSAAGSRISRRLGIPHVLEVNGRLAHDVRSQYRSPLEPLGVALERAKLRRADAIVTVSPGLAEILLEIGAPAERIVVIPNSLPDERVADVRPRPSSPLTIGWVGHLMRWHFDAVSLLIDAAPAVLAQLPGTEFLIIGGGPGLEELRARAQRKGVAPEFRLVGPVPYGVLPGALARIDIGVIPEVFDYAFPVKLVELGAAGAAVIAPRSSSLDRQLEPGVEYEPIPPGDPEALVKTIVELGRDPDRVALLGGALQRAVRDRFTWSATGRQIAATVDRVLDRRYDRP
jgi:glycosyltransferase involved in cell wall biosynthesis